MSWPVTWDGDEYQPLPESWVAHPRAEDRDQLQGPRLLAVAAALRTGRTLRVRYGHPATGEVLVGQTSGFERGGGLVPAALATGSGWPRSLRPGRSEPVDELRTCEREHLQALWGDRLDAPLDSGPSREVTA